MWHSIRNVASHNFCGGVNFEGSCLCYYAYRKIIAVKMMFVRGAEQIWGQLPQALTWIRACSHHSAYRGFPTNVNSGCRASKWRYQNFGSRRRTTKSLSNRQKCLRRIHSKTSISQDMQCNKVVKEHYYYSLFYIA